MVVLVVVVLVVMVVVVTNIPTTTTTLHTLKYGTFSDRGNSGFGLVLMSVMVMVGYYW